MSKSVSEIYKEIEHKKRFNTYLQKLLATLIDIVIVFVVIAFFSSHLMDGSDSFYSQSVRFLIPFIPIIYLVLIPVGNEANTVGRHLMKLFYLDYKTESKITLSQSFKREILQLITLIIAFSSPLILSGWIFDYIWVIGDNVSPQWTYAALYLTIPIFLFWMAVDIVTINPRDKNRSLQDYIAGTMPMKDL
jgi:uncharacterized RDD family membrane protein YckC